MESDNKDRTVQKMGNEMKLDKKESATRELTKIDRDSD